MEEKVDRRAIEIGDIEVADRVDEHASRIVEPDVREGGVGRGRVRMEHAHGGAELTGHVELVFRIDGQRCRVIDAGQGRGGFCRPAGADEHGVSADVVDVNVRAAQSNGVVIDRVRRNHRPGMDRQDSASAAGAAVVVDACRQRDRAPSGVDHRVFGHRQFLGRPQVEACRP